VAYSGGSLGAIVTPLIVTPIALYWGWRGGFWFTGFVGFAWILWWVVVSRRPDVREVRKVDDDRPREGMRLADRRLWSFMLAYALGALPIGFIIYGTAIYLSQRWGLSQADIGKVLWIPPLGWEAGYFFWGWLCDREVRSSADPIAAFRRLFTVALLAGLPLAFAPYLPAYGLVMAELFLAMFAASGFLILPIAYATHVYSSAHSGLIAGLGAGAWSAAVAVAMPLFGRLFDLHRLNESFALAAGFPIAGYVIWRWANAAPAAPPGR
jgi:ACS family hexuronate transporter-like MFS transporter